jgi:hypothetical protein
VLQLLPKKLAERLDDELRLAMHVYIESLQGTGGGRGASGAADGSAGTPPLQWTSGACDTEDDGHVFCILGAHGPAGAPAAAAVSGAAAPESEAPAQTAVYGVVD